MRVIDKASSIRIAYSTTCTESPFLLETYKDDPFISQRNKDGVNCIAWAAIEGHDKMVQLLYDKGGDLNNADSRGRTPLMEAALWGRPLRAQRR